MRAFILGNGPSLTPALLEALPDDAPTFAVNRIWKIFGQTSWRPDFYVRGETPTYNPEHVKEDLREMGKVGCAMYLQDGFRSLEPVNPHPLTRLEYFKTCDGREHDWHLPVICGYGTVVHIAIQIAVLEGFTEIQLLGCDLGDRHFYDDEPFTNADLARKAHEIAQRCCPVELIYEKEAHHTRA